MSPRLLPLLMGTALLAGPAQAQPLPFDMSPELHLREEAPAPPEPMAELAPPPPPAAELERFVLPVPGIRLEGEEARRDFRLYLTAEEAEAARGLHLGVLNAIVISPEASTLSVTVNDQEVDSRPINFSAAPTPLSIDLPQGLLVAGTNRIALAASQRHRTDCSVGSTYELWSEIYPDRTYLDFGGALAGGVSRLEDLPAIGADETGTTRIRLLAPTAGERTTDELALNLVQDLALALKAPGVAIELVQSLDEAPGPGTLDVVLALAADLPAALATLRPQAQAGPVAAFAPVEMRPNTLVVSGPGWPEAATAARVIERARQAIAEAGVGRLDLPAPVPVVTGADSIPLSAMGVSTTEFNGRRQRTTFNFALPGDFYATMYGEAVLVLDAAYSAAVLPGSQIEIYVNGAAASVAPILRTEGGTFRNSRLRIPMANFRPGLNRMDVEIVLLTREDEICPPGLTGRAAERFLFSAGSRLEFPEFGRIAAYPDLKSLAGTAAPYRNAGPVPVYLAPGLASLDAALDLFSRLAITAALPVPVRLVQPAELDPSGPAIVVAPLPSMPQDLVARSSIAVAGPGLDPGAAMDETALERWRDAMGGASSNPLERARDALAERLGLAPDNFWLIRREDGAYRPQSADAAILGQSLQPEGGVWTYLTIPREAAFPAAAARLTTLSSWTAVSGRISAVGEADERVLTLAGNTRLVPTQPLTPGNLRLIAANWLSTNVLEYALALALGALGLSFATAALLNRAGRDRKKR